MADIGKKISSLYELAKTFNNAELLKEISDLKMEISELTDENRELKEELRQLQFNKDNPLEFLVDGLYYDEKADHPYCPRCYEVDGKRVHLTFNSNPAAHNVHCPQCGKYFPKKPGK
jgi:hypothetical protein